MNNNLTSLIAFKDRGNFGDNKYRGNCSGKVIQALLRHFRPQFVADFMRGSDTTGDVCKYENIKHKTLDLNMGFDLINDDINFRYDFNFWHPPYWDIIKYSGFQYGKEPHRSDLSHIKNYDEFIKMLNYCLAKQYASLKSGGRMAILMGDIKKRGKLYSMLMDIQKLGTIENIIIKEQFNTESENKKYIGNFISIAHEYILILRKDNPFLYNLKITKNIELDIRDSERITWKDVVVAAYEKLGGKAKFKQIYELLQGHNKTKNNSNWKAKVRQVVQMYDKIFKKVGDGEWALI